MVLITGATGNVGREIVKQLARPGTPIRIMVRDPAKTGGLLLPGVEVVRGDFLQPNTLDDALAGIEKAFLLVPPHERMIEMEENFVGALSRSSVKHVVKLSALGAAVDSPARFLRWHAESERRIMSAGVPYTFLRPHQFMQMFLGFRDSINSQGAFFAPMGAGRIGLVDVRDVAAVAVQTIEEFGHDWKTYDVTGPQAIGYGDAALALTEALGRPVQYVDVPPETARAGMLQMGMPDWLADGVLELYDIWRNNGAAEVTGIVNYVAKREPFSFRDFARDYRTIFAQTAPVAE